MRGGKHSKLDALKADFSFDAAFISEAHPNPPLRGFDSFASLDPSEDEETAWVGLYVRKSLQAKLISRGVSFVHARTDMTGTAINLIAIYRRPNNNKIEEFLQEITSTLDAIPEGEIVVWGGDFNWKIQELNKYFQSWFHLSNGHTRKAYGSDG